MLRWPVTSLCLALALPAWVSGLALAAVPTWMDGSVHSLEIKPGPGEQFTLARFDCWFPSGDGPIAAVIVHQHGCGAKAGSSAATMVQDAQWHALARRHRCAFLVPRYDEANCAAWNSPANGSDRAFAAALRELGARSGHPELENLPWLLWGHSGGASWSVQMIVQHPGRVLALALRGGAAAQFGDASFRAQFIAVSRTLPMILISGESERSPESLHHVSWEPMQALTRELNAAGGLVAWTVDPRTEHHCGDSRLVVIPYFDAILTAREAGRNLAAVRVDEKSHAVTAADATATPMAKGAWLPSAALAEKWTEFMRTGTVTRVATNALAPELRAAASAGGRVTLRWLVQPGLESGVRTVRIYRNGSLLRELGPQPAEFIAGHGDTPPAELTTAELADSSAQPGLAYDYAVTFTSCSNAESPHSATAHVVVPFPPQPKSP